MSIARNALNFISTKSVLVSVPATRSFSVATVMQKDVLQDLFLKELKAYKPQPVATSEEGAAKEFKLPIAPTVPEIETDITQQLASYDTEPEEVVQ